MKKIHFTYDKTKKAQGLKKILLINDPIKLQKGIIQVEIFLFWYFYF